MAKYYKLFRYIFSGILISLLAWLMLYILVQKLHFWYLTSSVIAFCFGVILSYTIHKFFTFRNFSTKKMHLQFSIFFLYNLVMLSFNTFLMYLFVDIFGFWYLISQIVITAFLAFINYLFFNRIVFKN